MHLTLICHADHPIRGSLRQGISGLAQVVEIAYARFLSPGLLKFAYGRVSRPLHQEEGVHEEHLGAFIRPSGPTAQG